MFAENLDKITENLSFFRQRPSGIGHADADAFITPTDVLGLSFYWKLSSKLFCRNEFTISPKPLLASVVRKGLFKSVRQGYRAVLLESADLKSSFDKRTLFLRIPTISVGANVDTTNGIFAGHKRPGFTR